MSQTPISTTTEQFGVNQNARRARHMRVFSKSTFLRLPNVSFSSLFGSSSSAPRSSVLSKIAPLLHRGHVDAHHYTSPSQRLFTRYGAVVALLFFIGSFSPSNAYSDGFASGYVDLEGSWDQSATDAPLMADQEGYLTKANPQTGAGDRSTMNDFFVHTVASGETISTIAQEYNLKQNTVLWANNLDATSRLKINQQLLIPPVDGVYHQIGKKDTVEKIAKAYSVSGESILKQNGLTTSSPLAVGDEVFVPGGKPLIADAPTAPKAVGRDTPARIASTSRINAAADGAILQGSKDAPVGTKPFIFPTRGKITQGFHAGHYAFDIGNADRPAIWSAGAGTVVKVVSGCADVSYRCGGGYGNHVIVDHGNGLQTLYGHMTYPTVSVGQSVTQGEVIGKMGRSGNVRGRTGIHLHFEVRKNGVKKSPADYY
ncbi:MAG: M23 family metallopeptidase [Candidatus Gracilibacteria bacterium]